MCVCMCVFQVGLAKDLSLTNQLIDYLMGESDGMPKVNIILNLNLSSVSQCVSVSVCWRSNPVLHAVHPAAP